MPKAKTREDLLPITPEFLRNLEFPKRWVRYSLSDGVGVCIVGHILNQVGIPKSVMRGSDVTFTWNKEDYTAIQLASDLCRDGNLEHEFRLLMLENDSWPTRASRTTNVRWRLDRLADILEENLRGK